MFSLLCSLYLKYTLNSIVLCLFIYWSPPYKFLKGKYCLFHHCISHDENNACHTIGKGMDEYIP